MGKNRNKNKQQNNNNSNGNNNNKKNNNNNKPAQKEQQFQKPAQKNQQQQYQKPVAPQQQEQQLKKKVKPNPGTQKSTNFEIIENPVNEQEIEENYLFLQLFDNKVEKDEENEEDFSDDEEDDLLEAAQLEFLTYLIKPLDLEGFEKEYFEKKSLILKRNCLQYYDLLGINLESIMNIVNENEIQVGQGISFFGQDGNLDIDLQGEKIDLKMIQKKIEEQSNICLFKAERFNKTLAKVASLFEQYFGGNIDMTLQYTPQGTQGNSPSLEAKDQFILQLQGIQKWKLYKSMESSDQLSRSAKYQIQQEEIGNKMTECEQNQGDLIYIPRGTIFESEALAEDSLYLKIGFYENTCWTTVLEKALPQLLETATQENFQMRKGLPRNFMKIMGVQGNEQSNQGHDDKFNSSQEDLSNIDEEEEIENGEKKRGSNTKERQEFINRCKHLLMNMISNDEALEEVLDGVVDEMGIEFLNNRLPPLKNIDDAFQKEEKSKEQQEELELFEDFWEDYEIRLVQKDVGRLVSQLADEEDQQMQQEQLGEGEEAEEPLEDIVLHHCGVNQVQLQRGGSEPLIFPIEAAGPLEALFKAYPNYIAIQDLEMEDEQDKGTIAKNLQQNGIITFRKIKKEI